MKKIRKKVTLLVIALILSIIYLSVVTPSEEASAATKYIKVDEFIKYFVTELKLQLDENSATPYIDAAKKAGILKEGDFKEYDTYLTRTDCAVLANRIDKFIYGDHFGYADEVYELLKDCEYVDGKLYYNMANKLYPQGKTIRTYTHEQFLGDVFLARLSPYFNINTELRSGYFSVLDNEAKTIAEYIEIGPKEEGSLAGMEPFDENDPIILAWKLFIDENRKLTAVYNKRISDISKITKNKRQDVAEVVAKGIIKGFNNGKYIQNRSFNGSEKITVSGVKDVIKLARDKYARAPISPDGQLIRTTNLPKNAHEFSYILECFPNEFYEMVFYFQRLKPYIEGTMDKKDYHYPNNTGYSYLQERYTDKISIGMQPYEYYDAIVKKAEQYVNSIFNVDYRTVGDEWIKKLEGSYAPTLDDYYDEINRYLNIMKKNHVVVENKLISVEPSTLYEYNGSYFIRVYVKYRITADTIDVEDDYDLIFGSLTGTYLIGLKNCEWTYGYYDINLCGSNINESTYMEFGMDPWAGISDGALKGSK
jgi:hypothetical protein